MEKIYIKICVPKDNEALDEIREAGMFFESIASALYIRRDKIAEIDESNYLAEIKNIKNKFLQYDKS